MLPSVDRWKRLETLFYECLQLQPEARSAFLAESCGSDTKLREEVQALLKEADGSMDLLQQPISDAAQGLVAEKEEWHFAPGTTFDHYEVISLLARGGMGQVYLAEDTILKRKVALKVLAPEYLNDEQGLRRFQREALAASALNHPNIVTIYGCGNVNGVRFIVSEYVNGITLREKLSNSKLDLEGVLNIAVQLAEALAVAHSAGIIHRDIKPENIMVRDDGLVKILDFGIAKLNRALGVQQTRGAPDSSVTLPGILIGTVAYMSPEQATGEVLDARTDLFSLGIVLYEMVIGSTPFAGENAGSIIKKMLTEEPILPPSSATQISPGLEMVISKALQKKRNLRYQNAAEMRSDLQQLQPASETALVRSAPPLFARRPFAAAGKGPLLWFSIAGLVLVMFLLAAYLASRRKTQLTDKDTVVLSDFSNATGDPVFDGTLRQGLAAQLAQSPFLNLLSDSRIANTLTLMAKPKDTRLTGAMAREVCERTASAATIDGSIDSLGTQYVVGLKAVNCRTGDVLAEEQVTADSKEHVLKALGEAATQLRKKLGESLASVQKYDVPLESATTTSLDALQAYSLGFREMLKNEYEDAIPLLQRAITLDPNFALAYAVLGTAFHNTSQTALSAENTRKAYELRERVSERERFYIEAKYQENVLGNLEAARKTYELWEKTYPRDSTPPGSLAVLYAALGDYERALAGFQEQLRRDPDRGVTYANIMSAYINLGRFEEAKATAEQARARNHDSAGVHFHLYLIAFLQHDAAAMEREMALLRKYPGEADLSFFAESDLAAYVGQSVRAEDLNRRAVAGALHSGDKETAAWFEARTALRNALVGNFTLAQQHAKTALTRSRASDIVSKCALALALAGQPVQASRLADDLAREHPEDTIVQYVYLPNIRAASELGNRNPDSALKALAPTARYEMSALTLYPAYLRGIALVELGQGGAATTEFEKILDHLGSVGPSPIGALAHLGLGRAYAVTGDKDKARRAYEDFFALWKDADLDIPVLTQAKADYAMLR